MQLHVDRSSPRKAEWFRCISSERLMLKFSPMLKVADNSRMTEVLEAQRPESFLRRLAKLFSLIAMAGHFA